MAPSAPITVVSSASARGRGAPGDELLRCERLVIGHRGHALLPPIDLSVRRGSVLAVVGRNGSGKSTWFRTVLGFLAPLGGRIVRPSPAPRAAYMAQASALDAMLPVRAEEVVRWGQLGGWSFLRRSPALSRADAAAALEAVGATALRRSLFRDLSEGQKQRVLLARVLAAGADLAFLDEPTSAMDAVVERETMERLRLLTRERGMGVVVVSHIMGLVQRHADEVLYLDREHGVILRGAPREVFSHPQFLEQYGDVEI